MLRARRSRALRTIRFLSTSYFGGNMISASVSKLSLAAAVTVHTPIYICMQYIGILRVLSLPMPKVLHSRFDNCCLSEVNLSTYSIFHCLLYCTLSVYMLLQDGSLNPITPCFVFVKYAEGQMSTITLQLERSWIFETSIIVKA